MKSVREIIALARHDSGCQVLPTSGQPKVAIKIPDDLSEFYSLCGGLDIYPTMDWGWRIVSPDKFVPTLDATGFGKKLFETGKHGSGLEDTLYYIAVRGAGPDSVSIDLRKEILGVCYDTFDGDFLATHVYIVALSFTELLNNLFFDRSDEPYDADNAYGCIGLKREFWRWREKVFYDDLHFGRVAPEKWVPPMD